jgi:hypothetical protein
MVQEKNLRHQEVKMNLIRNSDSTIFFVAAEIAADLEKLLPLYTCITFVIKPGGSPCMKIYVTPTQDEPVVSHDYFRWAKSRVAGFGSDKEAPCFMFWRMADLFASVEMVVQSYGGEPLDHELESQEATFTYLGPFLANDFLPFYMSAAAYTARMPYAIWKAFWREHSEKARRDMRRYVDESFFRVWHG